MKNRPFFFMWLLLCPYIGVAQISKNNRKNLTVTLYNSAGQNIKIQIGVSQQSLSTYQISTNDKWISPIYNTNQLLVLTSTINNRPTLKVIKVELGKVYVIFWNGNVLDVKQR